MFSFFSPAPEKLDWGAITPEAFNANQQEALTILNVDITSAERIERCVIFTVGKLNWLQRHLPGGSRQKVVFDLRGQPLALVDRARRMKADILREVTLAHPTSHIAIEINI